ncbi:mediator complex subunit 24 isoform X1 [Rhodnius prolixus]|uniref:mediator complex subunit 24 isoform X1 n=2 Tax=Rhodnius prolixus TaxID=13249 RepID=UPI003D1882A9
MESSKVTSKTSSLKALLLRAWRERWSDLQWGIHIKTILPRGVSGDVYNLADCILQQALVGPAPNQLVLSYLKHSLSSQLVSYASVLQRIAKFDGFHKPHCISCLLEFIESIQSGITCRGKPEEGILASAILNLVHWLLQCYQHAVSTNAEPTADMIQKPVSILHNMLNCDFLTAMLYLAKHDDIELYNEVVKKCQEIEELLTQHEHIATAAPLHQTLTKICKLELGATSLTNISDREVDVSEPLTYCVQALLAVQVMINPSADTAHLANQLRLLQKLKGYRMSRLCCEVIRACLMSLNDVLGLTEETKWGAFTFLKLPHILLSLTGSNLVSSADGDYSQDVAEAVQLLIQFVPLVDLMDSPISSNCIEALLTELTKLKLLNETHISAYTASRDLVSSGLSRLDSGSPTSTPILKVIIRAQPTLQRILKTLDADYAKIQDALPNVLCQVLNGKSFELILSVASVEGKLRTFVSKLIKFNECAKSGSTARPILFDITFVMLCSIVQTNGSRVVFEEGDRDGEKSFFERWAEECMIERGKPKCPDTMLKHADPVVVDALLAQLNSPQPDLSNIGLGWDNICMSVAAAMKEVVIAWQQEALSVTDVKRILDNMRQSMCCLPICASAWLCSYMQILHQDALLKPMNMVQQFLSSPIINEEGSQQDTFKERSTLMVHIIRKMQYDMHLATSSKMKVITLSHSIISKEPMSEELAEIWSGVQEKGWLNISATHALESLFMTAGPQWFVISLVKEIMKLRYKEELDRAVDLALAVFHLDIETCTDYLLTTVLPQYLHNSILSNDIVEPQSSALAKLCSYCIYAAWQSQSSYTRKRPLQESEDLSDLLPTKLLRLEEGPMTLKGSASEQQQVQVPPLRPPLSNSLKIMFNSFSLITEHIPYISQQTHFVFRVLELLVTCGRDQTRPVLQDMPNTLVPSLLRALPNLFSTDLVLRLYDLTSPAGRKATASDLCLLRNLSLKPTF